MPSTSPGYASQSGEYIQRPEMASKEAQAKARNAALCPTDDDAILPRRSAAINKLDKRSTEYILKSGLAGGLAGCAVCTGSEPLPLC